VLIFWDPVAALISWLVAMTARSATSSSTQSYDVVNNASHGARKRSKVGYNLKRKVVLLTIWALSPCRFFGPLFGIFRRTAQCGVCRHVALIGSWSASACNYSAPSAVLPQDVQTGLVWAIRSHRPVPRHQALLQGAAATAAGRVVRRGGRGPGRTSETP
jgi:hypothetical protein